MTLILPQIGFEQWTSPAVVLPSASAIWKFSEGSGTSLADTSGNSNTGTIHSGSWTGSYVNFDGSSTFISFPGSASLNITSAFSITAWIKANNNNCRIFSSVNPSPPYNGYELGIKGGTGVGSGDPSGAPNGSLQGFASTWIGGGAAAASVATNTLTHVGVSADGTTISFYVNGSLTGSAQPYAETPGSYAGQKTLGSFSDGTLSFFNGQIGRDVRVYGSALTANQMAYLYANT